MLRDTSCCGLDEIDGLCDSPVATLLEVADEKYGDYLDAQQAFILFTDVMSKKRGNSRGEKLAGYIKKNGLGTVVMTQRAKKNPNSGNMIKAWVWSPNERALRAWWTKNRDNNDETY